MAFNWNNVTGRTMSNAGTGSLFGGWGTLIGAGGGLVGGILDEGSKQTGNQDLYNMGQVAAWMNDPGGQLLALLGGDKSAQSGPKAPTPQQVNPYTDAFRNQLMSGMDNWDNTMKEYLAQGEGYKGQTANILDQLRNFKSQVTYDPNAATRQLFGQAPALQALARSTVGTGSGQEDLRAVQEQALRDVAAQFGAGSLDNGAFNQAAITAMANPRFQYAQQQQALSAQAQNDMLARAQQAYENNQQYNTSMGLQKEGMELGALGQAAQGYSDLTTQALQAAGLFNQRVNTGLGILGDYNAPTWYTEPMILPDSGGGSGDLTSTIMDIVGMIIGSGALKGKGATAQGGGINTSGIDFGSYGGGGYGYANPTLND